MGCDETKDLPALLCFFEAGNEDQKNYCLKLKDNFQHNKRIRFEIKSLMGIKFSIKFKINGKVHEIQTNFDSTEGAMNQALQQMYNLLDQDKS